MLEKILSAYKIRDVVEVTPIPGGLINTTWRIKTPSEDFILQKINKQIFKDPTDFAKNISLIAQFLLEKKSGLFVRSSYTNE